MNQLLRDVKETFDFSREDDGCRAVVGDGEVCGDDWIGRTEVSGCSVKYCSKHRPSESLIAGGRLGPIELYIPEYNTTVEADTFGK